MKFSDIIDHAKALLQRQGRLTYRSLKREFELDDEAFDDLKFELIEGQRLATDEDGKVLVWLGPDPEGEKVKGGNGEKTRAPGEWTPPHLAQRIRAEQAALEARGSTDGERKTITALSADLKGSTALIEGLDPEDARAVIDPALQLMMDAVHLHDGFVARALGDAGRMVTGAEIWRAHRFAMLAQAYARDLLAPVYS